MSGIARGPRDSHSRWSPGGRLRLTLSRIRGLARAIEKHQGRS